MMQILYKLNYRLIVTLLLLLISPTVFAASSLGQVANTLTGMTGSLAHLITAMMFTIGFGFGVGALIKYKAYRDNPKQILLSQPVMLFFVALVFLFFGAILVVTGNSVFGTGYKVGQPLGVTTLK